MAIWSTETLKARVPQGNLIEPYSEARIVHAAYELSLGSDAFITSDDRKTDLCSTHQLLIPPGQFGLLITEEVVKIPNDAIALISIKADIKFRGLVNVSGFHVDPGFSGKLKFSVYNAGSQNMVLDRNQRTFLIWFCSLDRPTSDVYDGGHLNQSNITSNDVMRIQGDVASPAALKIEIDKLRNEYEQLSQNVTMWRQVTTGLFIAITLLIVRWVLSI